MSSSPLIGYPSSSAYELTTELSNQTDSWTNASTEEYESPEIDTLNNVSRYLWMVLSPILFVVGIVGNILNLMVLKKLQFWRKPPYFFITFLALSDMTVLCVGLSRYWINETFGFDLRTISDAGCKTNLFVIYWSMHLSSWFLVCFVFERYLKTNHTFKYIRIVTSRRCLMLVVCVAVALAGVDLHFFWTNGLKDSDCDSLNKAFHYFDEFVFVYIDFSVMSVIPFLAMTVMNIFIVKVIRQQIKWRRGTVRNKSTNNRMKKVDIRLTKMMLFTSLYFFVATMPISVYFIVDSYVNDPDDKLQMARKDLAWTLCYIFQFSNYTINFILYNLSNPKFRKKFKEIILCKAYRFKRRETPYFAQTSNSSARTNSMSLTESSLPDNNPTSTCSLEDNSVTSESEVHI